MRKQILLLALLVALSQFTTLAQLTQTKLVESVSSYEEIRFQSIVLEEERRLWVSLPKGYSKSDESYPILYVLDAQSHFKMTRDILDFLSDRNKIPHMILVGIPLVESDNLVRDRIRDYSPTYVEVPKTDHGSKPWQKSGNAHIFRSFMKTEVIPQINAHYRTQPYAVLAGHSQGGLLAVSSLLADQRLFSAYIAASPSLWWDEGVIVRQAQTALNDQFDNQFYVSLADGDSKIHHEYTRAFTNILQYDAPQELKWKFDVIANESHSSTVFKSYYNGLTFIYQNWSLPPHRISEGISGLKAHFDQLSKTYGYTIRPSERMINGLGYEQVWAGQLDRAIEFFIYNTELYPHSANAFDSLAEGYMRNNQKDKAIRYYQKSLNLDPNNRNAERMLTQLLN